MSNIIKIKNYILRIEKIDFVNKIMKMDGHYYLYIGYNGSDKFWISYQNDRETCNKDFAILYTEMGGK